VVVDLRCRELIEQHGCRAIIILYHPTKAGAESEEIEITKYLPNSRALAGFIDAAFGFRRIQNSSEVYVKRFKERPWEDSLDPFTLTVRDDAGASYLSRGEFPILDAPGEAGQISDHGTKKKSKLSKREQQQKIARQFEAEGKSRRWVAENLGVSHTTINNWLGPESQQEPLPGCDMPKPHHIWTDVTEQILNLVRRNAEEPPF
jgi:hypothetical protein